MGDQAFFGGARSFLQSHRYRKAGTEDLREALEAASGLELKPYFRRWIYDTGLPSVSWTSATAGAASGFSTTVDLRPRNFPGPLPLMISVTTASGTETRTVKLAPEGGSFTVETRELPRRVALNEDRGLLAQLERAALPAQR
jgi:aminopeptidase N